MGQNSLSIAAERWINMATRISGPPKLEMTIKCFGKEQSRSQLVRILALDSQFRSHFSAPNTSKRDCLPHSISYNNNCSIHEYADSERIQPPHVLAVLPAQVNIRNPASELLNVTRSVDTRTVIRRSRTSRNLRRMSRKAMFLWSINCGSGF